MIEVKKNNCILQDTEHLNVFRYGCKALNDIEVMRLIKAGKCGTYDCPFYKKSVDEER